MLSRFLAKWSVALPVVLAMGAVCSGFTPGQTQRYVATTGTDTGACTDSNAPCKTITYAVSQSVAATPTGDTIHVAGGIYSEAVTVSVAGLQILGAQSGVDARTRTGVTESILDGASNSGKTSFYITASSVTIDGFTVQNATNGNQFGQGILIGSSGLSNIKLINNIVQQNIVGIGLSGTNITIQYNLIQNNNQSGPSSGDGIYTDEYLGGSTVESNVTIDSNTFKGNTDSGIDVSTFTASKAVQSFTVSNNTFDMNGRGLILFNFKSSSITNNTFSNTTNYAIGLLGNVTGVTITGNTMGTGAYGVRVRNIFDAAFPNSTVSIHTNNILGSTTAGLAISQVNDAANGEFQPAYSGTLDATCNYWGSSTGPMSPDNSGGMGDLISAASGQVTDIPFLVAAGPSGSCSGGPQFITAQVPGAVRNDFSGFVGMKFTVGSTPITLTALGRIFVAGNTGTHNLKLVTASNGIDVPGGAASIDMSSAPSEGAYKYTSLASSLTLQANTAYFLLSQESIGGDQWYNPGPVTSTSAATVNGPEYQDGAGTYNLLSLPGQAYVPVNFIYTSQSAGLSATITAPANNATVKGNNVTVTVNTTGPVSSIQLQIDGANVGNPMTVQPNQQPPYNLILDTTTLSNGQHSLTAVVKDSQNNSATSPAVTINVNNTGGGASGTSFVTGQTAGTVRNNFSGFAGFKFTVGSTPLTVNSLGRIYLAGNSGTHTIKLVQASNNADVPGGSASLTMTSGTPNTYQFALLGNPVALQANTTYFLLSQEQSGGDTWYDAGPITTTSDAVVNGPAYQDGNGTYNTLSSPGQAYVPVNFTFGASSSNLHVTITSPTGGSTVSGNSVTVNISATGPVASVQLTIDGKNVGNPSTTPPYTLSFDSTGLSNGIHTLIAVASDGQGGTALSNAVFVNVSNGASGGNNTFISGQSPGAVRNNFNGYVGMAFTVGSLPITVTQLGRFVVSGNNGTHTLKLVVANTGADVPGGSVSISLAVAVPNTYRYGILASPILLQANTTYYVLSFENAGGDQWYDIGHVTSASAASVNGPAYQDGNGTYNVINSLPNNSYVPMNFMFQQNIQ